LLELFSSSITVSTKVPAQILENALSREFEDGDLVDVLLFFFKVIFIVCRKTDEKRRQK
jgi:hypothetical protein